MGYNSQSSSADFTIPQDRIPELMRVLSNGNSPVKNDSSLRNAFDMRYGFAISLDGNGISEIRARPCNHRYDEKLFDLIAPFVEPGSYLNMFGEDGAHWRYEFRNGTWKRLEGTIEYQKWETP
jgi:hypothetical protein